MGVRFFARRREDCRDLPTEETGEANVERPAIGRMCPARRAGTIGHAARFRSRCQTSQTTGADTVEYAGKTQQTTNHPSATFALTALRTERVLVAPVRSYQAGIAGNRHG